MALLEGLRQFQQNPARGCRMNECDFCSTCSDSGRVVDHLGVHGFEFVQLIFNVLDCQADMVQSGTALLQELTDRRVRRKWLQKLDVRVACIQLGYRDSLLLHDFGANYRQAKYISIVLQSLFQTWYGNGDVIDGFDGAYSFCIWRAKA